MGDNSVTKEQEAERGTSWRGYSTGPKRSFSGAMFHDESLVNPGANAALDGSSAEPGAAAIPSPAALGRSAVRERQIDFLLQEEFSLGPDFLQMFLEAAQPTTPEYSAPKVIAILDVRASVRDQHTEKCAGETDVLVRYTVAGAPDASVSALLIENKIDAPYQPNQAAHYAERGRLGVKFGYWSDFATCIVAPASYIKPGHGFDLSLSLEKVSELLAPDSTARRAFKQGVIAAALNAAKLVGPKILDEGVTQFRLEYFQAFQRFRSEATHAAAMEGISAQTPHPAWYDDTWFIFRSEEFRPAYIVHKAFIRKISSGAVDLSFPNSEVNALAQRFPLEGDMHLVQTGKSASIRIAVPAIELCIGFPEKRHTVEEALCAVMRLAEFYRRHRSLLPSS